MLKLECAGKHCGESCLGQRETGVCSHARTAGGVCWTLDGDGIDCWCLFTVWASDMCGHIFKISFVSLTP